MKKILLALLITLYLSANTAAGAGGSGRIESGILRASDNVPIAYDRFVNGSDTVIIVCPGFYNSKENRWMRKTVELLCPSYDVLIFDFRGHGKSGGKYTWSAKEPRDLEAVLDYAKSCGYRKIGIVAFSLGAAVAVNEASVRDDIDSMVLISIPSKINMINFHFWEPEMFSDLKDNIECGWEGKGARTGNIFLPKDDPIDIIGRIKKTPMLFIHGDHDWIIKDRHSRVLYGAANVEKRLEIIKGGLHAERMIQSDPEGMKRLMLDWFFETLK
ncbi:MAG: alpha/beta hydrolase [Candidatus Omnitrophica bacterium]|nr:alpha/beta hydrolase [Candidatus Omnitrophota bacterium]MBU1038357.1 alpha/beta hydrolase [Candidatus Omnitrophota bacterium]MBU1808994.1 alpha/beta hydrolase [Candidatus Omnitrophota bacterium]